MSLYVGVLKWGSPVVTIHDDWMTGNDPRTETTWLCRRITKEPNQCWFQDVHLMIHPSELTAVREEKLWTSAEPPQFSASSGNHWPVDTQIQFFNRLTSSKIGYPHSSGWSSCSPLKLIYVWSIPYFHHQFAPEFYAEKCRGSFAEGERHRKKKTRSTVEIWQCVKTLYPCSSHQSSWDLWMFIPLKMVLIELIGIDPYPYVTQSDTRWCPTSKRLLIQKQNPNDGSTIKHVTFLGLRSCVRLAYLVG